MNAFEGFLIHFLPSLGFLLALFLFVHILKTQRSPASTLSWLLAIVLIPYIGVPLYILFGGRKLKQITARKEEMHSQGLKNKVILPGGVEGLFKIEDGNHLDLLSSGEIAFASLMKELSQAKKSIYITTYVLGEDETGRNILQVLIAKASEGVRVRLLLDAIGSFKYKKDALNELERAGGKFAFFMPMLRLPFRGRANLRNHRKIVIIDEETAIAGGMNLAGEYMGMQDDPHRWRDLSFFLKGPILDDFYSIFQSDWKFASGEQLNPYSGCNEAKADADRQVTMQAMPSGPDVKGDPLHEAIVTSFFTAKKRIWIVTPYFIPDEMLLRSLEIALKRGVDVRLLLPRKSNHLLADLARRSYVRQLSDSGGKIYFFQPGMMHGKLILIDDEIGVSGSANMDVRSLFLNYEVAFFIYSEDVVKELEVWTENLMRESDMQLKKTGAGMQLLEGAARLLSPLL